MLKTSPILVTQSLIDLADNKFDGDDSDTNEAKILSTFFMFKNPNGASYLTSSAKKALNFLKHVFI